MAIKVLDYNGLKQLTSKIKDYVNKSVSGKANKRDLTKLINDLKIQDTRDDNKNPEYYMKNNTKEVIKEFKRLNAVGIETSSSGYCVLVTISPWHDNSGGYPVQLAFKVNDTTMYTRIGTSDTAWGKWRKVLDETDLKTKLSQLSEDSTHRLVTDAEKAKWNNKAEKSYVDSAKANAEKNTKTLTDALAKDLRENVDSINANKADKTALNSYVKKVSGKGLSTNDFTNAYKARFDRDVRTDAQVMALADKVAYKKELWGSNNLSKYLNDYYGLNLSSSINSWETMKKSSTAINSALNNAKVYEDLQANPSVLRVFSDIDLAAKKIVSDTKAFERIVHDSAFNEIIFTSKYWINEIIKNEKATKIIGSDDFTVVDFIKKCPYLKVINISGGSNSKMARNIELLNGGDKFIFVVIGDDGPIKSYTKFKCNDETMTADKFSTYTYGKSNSMPFGEYADGYISDVFSTSSREFANGLYRLGNTIFELESTKVGLYNIVLSITELEQDLARGL